MSETNYTDASVFPCPDGEDHIHLVVGDESITVQTENVSEWVKRLWKAKKVAETE